MLDRVELSRYVVRCCSKCRFLCSGSGCVVGEVLREHKALGVVPVGIVEYLRL